jgi:hypothetical protein
VKNRRRAILATRRACGFGLAGADIAWPATRTMIGLRQNLNGGT